MLRGGTGLVEVHDRAFVSTEPPAVLPLAFSLSSVIVREPSVDTTDRAKSQNKDLTRQSRVGESWLKEDKIIANFIVGVV